MTRAPHNETPDAWSKGFSRAVQVVGMVVFLWQAAWAGIANRPVQPWLLMFTGSMMLGSVGLKPLTQALRVLMAGGGNDDDHE